MPLPHTISHTFDDEKSESYPSIGHARTPSVLPGSNNAMANTTPAAVAAEEDSTLNIHVSASQRMLSATSGSIVTSLLVTPLDVVRVRLQSQPHSQSSGFPLKNASMAASFGANNGPDLGVRACCREVFWVSNTAPYCLATTPSVALNQAPLAIGAMSSPSHSSTLSTENCAVEEARRKTFTTTFDGLRKIARNEGFTTLWRGLSPTLLMTIPANVIYFTGYDWLRYNPTSPVQRSVPDNYAPLAAGSVARVAAAFAVSPIEMFRTRMQASSGNSTSIFRDTFKGLGDVVRAQGYTSLWRGLTLTMWRDVPFSGLYWWGYEAVRNSLTDWRDNSRGRLPSRDESRHSARNRSRSRDNRKTTFVDSFIAGATSGAIASLITTPFDVGKTRQQVFAYSNDMATTPTNMSASGSASKELLPEERSMPRFLYHILKTEGVGGLFKGWVARCLKVAPACAIMISSYEVGKKMAQRANERRLE